MARLKCELWRESDQEQTLCYGGPMGDDARALLLPGATLVWTVEGESHFDTMTKYYIFMGWGTYTTDHEWDYKPFPDEWLTIQQSVAPNRDG